MDWLTISQMAIINPISQQTLRLFDRRELTTTIDPGMYLCIYCDRFAKEKEYALRPLDHAAQNGHAVAGGYLCEVLTDLP